MVVLHFVQIPNFRDFVVFRDIGYHYQKEVKRFPSHHLRSKPQTPYLAIIS